MTDYLKREDVLKLVFPNICSDALKGQPCQHMGCALDCYGSDTFSKLAALPPDPVAAAAIRLAEATAENWVNLSGRATPKMLDSLIALRAAVEAAK